MKTSAIKPIQVTRKLLKKLNIKPFMWVYEPNFEYMGKLYCAKTRRFNSLNELISFFNGNGDKLAVMNRSDKEYNVEGGEKNG